MAATLPTGTVVVDPERGPCLVAPGTLQPFTFGGWATAFRPPAGDVAVLTPPTSVAALAGGFTPTLHPSALV